MATKPVAMKMTVVAFLLLFFSACCSRAKDDARTYIIHLSPKPDHVPSHEDWHRSFLPDEGKLVFSYGRVFSGFAARLTAGELDAVRSAEGFVRAEPDERLQLHTTHSAAFLGLDRVAASTGLWSESGYGRGVVIGLIDTGIDPGHPSFNDAGMPPPPTRWKGRCEFQLKSLCNNKIIGARSFVTAKGGPGNSATFLASPLDDDGHGTHTAGTAAGRFVAGASVLGSAMGTAAGMAPDAHLAVYKVCDVDECNSAGVLAAIEAAVEDGVDVLSISLGRPGGSALVPLHNNSIAIASFGAAARGVFFSASAGNDGAEAATVGNVAPWVLTVAASTTDRRIRAVVRLGNGREFEGESAYQPPDSTPEFLPLVSPLASNVTGAVFCSNATALQLLGVRGKVVLCVTGGGIDRVGKGRIAKSAGAAAMVLMSLRAHGFDTYAEAHEIPASHVSYADGLTISKYAISAPNPSAVIIFKGTRIGGVTAPAVAAFSSRGPSLATPGVLKPDVTGPGVNVLAAWPTVVGPVASAPLPYFNMISGTSMSCPHLSGIAALLKSAHPDWSPAMIKSAIMTTSDVTTLDGSSRIRDQFQLNLASYYAMGAGHVNPLRASNPGLVYDIKTGDYVAYLCSIGYTDAQVAIITQATTNCREIVGTLTSPADLNYPSITVDLNAGNGFKQAVSRTVTNVGEANATYTVTVAAPEQVVVTVSPGMLVFTEKGQKAAFAVSFAMDRAAAVGNSSVIVVAEASLTWSSSDGRFRVRSPVSVTSGLPSDFQVETMMPTLGLH